MCALYNMENEQEDFEYKHNLVSEYPFEKEDLANDIILEGGVRDEI